MDSIDTMKLGMFCATASLKAAFQAMKIASADVEQSEQHRLGVVRGIDLCLEVIAEVEAGADKMLDEVRQELGRP